MKILHIIYTHGVSGAEKYLDYLLPGIKQFGITCDVIFICPPASSRVINNFSDQLQKKGIKVTVIIATRRMLFSTIKKINSYLKENGISVVHSHLINTDILVSLLKQFFNRKIFIISTKHGYDEKVLNVYSPNGFKVKKDLYYYITRYTLKMIDKNLSISKGMADLFYNLKITKEHYPVIHHGINVVIPSKIDPVFRRAPQQLIIAGRLETMKGHEHLINTIPAIVKRYPECKLLILGEGSLKNKLISRCEQLDIRDSVEFVGFQNDPYSFIASSDVIVLPSLFEPFGLVYIEAHALKVPVVAFDTPAANELMENEVTGLLVPKFDNVQLAEKILHLLDNAELRTRIADNAYLQYLNKFTADIMIKNTANWYLTLQQ